VLRVLALAGALGAALVLAGSTTAAAAKRITLQIGDSVEVAGTDIGCETAVGTKVLKGQKLITCFKLRRGLVPGGSYVPALAANGRIVVVRAKADGSAGDVVFDRRPSAVGARPKPILARPGDQLFLAGTSIACVISSDDAGTYPSCLLAREGTGRPGSLAFAETVRFVAVVRFNSTGVKTKIVFKRFHA
jgi:hypothetical protein